MKEPHVRIQRLDCDVIITVTNRDEYAAMEMFDRLCATAAEEEGYIHLVLTAEPRKCRSD